MKKLLLCLAVFCYLSVNAQKVYSTKTASIRFYSSTPMEDIEATNSQVESKMTDKGDLQFALLIKGFKFENELMQEHFNGPEWMNSNQFPKAEFRGKIVDFLKVNLQKDGTYPVKATGVLTIRGVKQPITATGNITVNNKAVSSKSVFKIKVKDFGITGKDIGKSIANELEITVNSKY